MGTYLVSVPPACGNGVFVVKLGHVTRSRAKMSRLTGQTLILILPNAS